MSRRNRIMAVLSVAALLAGACSDSSEPAASESPPTTVTTTSSPTEAAPQDQEVRHYAVASANDHASQAGIDVLAQGGSAVDAAVAIQTVLGLVEPQSSGIGGGAFMLHYDADTKSVTSYDGREEAPGGASATMFLDDGGQPLGFFEASGSGHAVGTPGVVAMLALAHDDHGALQWDTLFEPAIALADGGFSVSERMGNSLGLAQAFGASDDFIALYSNDEGELLQEGDHFVNGAYAESLRAVADNPRAMYEGELATAIVDATVAGPIAGTLTTADLAGYTALRADPICRPYREFALCGAPPPTSGGIGVLSLMGQLDTVDMSAPATPDGWHMFVEASQRAYSDRDLYVGDDRFVDVPTDALLDPDYLAARAATIDPANATSDVAPGEIAGFPRAADSTDEPSGTSHFVVVDADGDVVTMTTSVESVFGSRRVAGGFVLNNQLTDFAREPSADGSIVANEIAPGKRPRSSMAPTLVLDPNGEVRLALGSPGGSSIIAYVSKTLVAMLDWELSAEEAILLPNVVARSGTVSVEGTASTDLTDALTAFGHQVAANSSENSGVHLIEIHPDGSLTGAADSRREGTFRAQTSELSASAP